MQQHQIAPSERHPLAAAGADGCRAGWVVATREGVVVVPSLRPAEFAAIGVDMPIGLSDKGPRACDTDARGFLGTRRSTVFPTPPRACLGALDHADAVARSRATIGVGISIQAFHLLPKIREVDALVDLAAPDRIVEVHPECAFAFMSGGAPLPPKRTAAGVTLRRALLAERFERVEPAPRGAATHDLLDAYAVLWSTERFLAGTAHVFGDGERDARGIVMRIVA